MHCSHLVTLGIVVGRVHDDHSLNSLAWRSRCSTLCRARRPSTCASTSSGAACESRAHQAAGLVDSLHAWS